MVYGGSEVLRALRISPSWKGGSCAQVQFMSTTVLLQIMEVVSPRIHRRDCTWRI